MWSLVLFASALPLVAQFSWVPMNGPYGYTSFDLFAIDSTGGLWGSTSQALYRSSDKGASWYRSLQNIEIVAAATSPSGARVRSQRRRRTPLFK